MELHCSHKYGRAEGYCLLDNGMVTHRVDDRQPIEYRKEGLTYGELHIAQGSEIAQ